MPVSPELLLTQGMQVADQVSHHYITQRSGDLIRGLVFSLGGWSHREARGAWEKAATGPGGWGDPDVTVQLNVAPTREEAATHRQQTLLYVKPDGAGDGVPELLLQEMLPARGLKVLFESPTRKLPIPVIDELWSDWTDWRANRQHVHAQMRAGGGAGHLIVVEGLDAIGVVKNEVVGSLDTVPGSVRRKALDRMARNRGVRTDLSFETRDPRGVQTIPELFNQLHAPYCVREVLRDWSVLSRFVTNPIPASLRRTTGPAAATAP